MNASSLKSAVLLAALAAQHAAAAPPTTVLELNGWMLGQHQSAVSAYYPTPYQSHDAGPIRNDVHVLDRDSKTYMIFSIDESRPTNYLLMVQLTGGPTPAQKHAFLGLRLGDPAARVREVLGEPDQTRTSDLPGVTMWDYTQRNYTVEIGADDRLYSIRLEYWTGLPSAPPKEEVGAPPLKPFTDAIKKRDVEALVKLLMPDVEVYIDGEPQQVAGPFRDQLADPTSPVAAALFGKPVSVAKALANAAGPPEVDVRIWEDAGVGWVVKYPQPKSGPQIVELVWKYYPGGWRVWEIFVASAPLLREQ